MNCPICGREAGHCDICHRAARAANTYQPGLWERIRMWWYAI